jgi:hypothetical protein
MNHQLHKIDDIIMLEVKRIHDDWKESNIFLQFHIITHEKSIINWYSWKKMKEIDYASNIKLRAIFDKLAWFDFYTFIDKTSKKTEISCLDLESKQ